jgi:hypothetical protein
MRFRLRALLRDPEPNPAGGGGTPPPAVPPAAPAAIDYAEIGKIVAAQVAEAIKGFTASPPTPAAPPTPEGGSTDPKYVELKKNYATVQADLDAVRKRAEESERRADEKDRQAQIGTVLNKYQFASEEAAADARALFFSQVARVKDGDVLVGPDGTTPYDKYIRDALEGSKSFFLAPKNVSGAGAGNPGARGGKAIDLDDIKPGMSADAMREAAAQIAALGR